MTFHLPIPCDLSLEAYAEAIRILGTGAGVEVVPAALVLCCSRSVGNEIIEQVWERYRSTVCYVPDDILVGEGDRKSWSITDTWGNSVSSIIK